MSRLLTVYSQVAFTEYYLPPLINDDYEITMDNAIFNLPEPVVLKLEAVNSEWYIKNDGEISLSGVAATHKRYELRPNSIFVYKKDSTDIMFIIIVSEIKNAVHAFDKIDVRNHSNLTVGSYEGNMIQFQFHKLISSYHAEIVWAGSDCYLVDKSKNGVFVNNRRCQAKTLLHFGDIINIYGLTLVFLTYCIGIDTATDVKLQSNLLLRYVPQKTTAVSKPAKKAVYFKRSPRILGKYYDEPFEIEGPPAPQKVRRQPLLLTIGPSFTMVIPMLLGTTLTMVGTSGSGSGFNITRLTGIVVAASAGIMAAVWAVARVRQTKKEEKEEEKRRVEEYELYIQKNEDELKYQTGYNARLLVERYPAALECTGFTENTLRLWNRNISHTDMLYVRLGIGTLDFQAPIQIPKERFSLVNDVLAEYPKKLKRKYEKMNGVPVGIDLMHMPIVGLLCTGNRAKGLSVARSMITQIAANNCYTDVKLVFLYDETEQAQWQFARWLPHTWSEDGKTRFIASDKAEAADVLYELSCVFRERETKADDPASTNKKLQLPHYVVVLADPSMIENEAISKYLISRNDIGVTTIYISEAYDDLPNECTNIIECSNSFNGMYDVSMMQEDRTSINYDLIDENVLDRFARRLSNFRVSEPGSGGEIPNSITFLDMYGVKALNELNVIDRWRKSKTYDTLRAMIGVKGGNAPIYLDIHEKYHGPHGMVAGTTGSGKSETIQTYMLSMALNYSPLDVGFFVIDYKGGGMANLFSDLPHMMGTITNLSGNQVHRSMISIKSEIKRRQRIFAENDVNNIDKYTRLYKNKEAALPVPHLLIIIDEFAELKREQPEFMSELISVAQVGRSLGIHLILATQKPGNVVDDNIRSNSKFRLCLRVQDKIDSNDMINRPDAAYITQTGRGYLQVGNDEIFELFQSGWSGAPYDSNAGETKAESAYLITKNGHSVVGKRQKIKLKEQRRYEWTAYLLDVIHSCLDKNPNNIIKSIYANLEKQGIEYPQSASNDNKFKRLIDLDNEIKSQYGAMSGHDEAATIISMAAEKHIALPDEKEKSQLAAIVEHISAVARDNDIHNDIRLWLPVLAEKIPLDTICSDILFDGKKWIGTRGEIAAIIGYADDPENQSQFPIGVSFTENGHVAVCGGVLSGKSTFIQTLLYSLCMKYDPDSVNIYVLDFSNKMLLPFEKAPQVGAVLTEDETEKIAKLYVMLKKELERRKKLLRGGSYVQYIRSHKLPAIILAIDGYASMREKTEDAYEENMLELSREGASYGIYLLIASGNIGMNDIKARIADNIKTFIGMAMGDKFKYADIFHTTNLDVLPEEGVKGRGLIQNNGEYLEFQTAVAVDAEDDYTRGQMIERTLEQMAMAWQGPGAKKIPVIPDKPTWEEFRKNAEFAEAMEDKGLLPVGYRKKDAGIFSIPLSKIFSYLIVGKPKSGKTNLLRIVANSAVEKGAKVIYADPNALSARLFENNDNIEYYSSPTEYMALGNSIIKTIVERNLYKNEIMSKGLSSEEIQALMEEKYCPTFVIIDNLTEFIKQIYDKNATKGDVSGFFENFADKGELHNVYMIAAMQPDDISSIKGRRFGDLVLARRSGVLLGGMAGEQRILGFDDLSFKERSVGMKTNNGMATLADGEETVYVVIPTAK